MTVLYRDGNVTVSIGKDAAGTPVVEVETTAQEDGFDTIVRLVPCPGHPGVAVRVSTDKLGIDVNIHPDDDRVDLSEVKDPTYISLTWDALVPECREDLGEEA